MLTGWLVCNYNDSQDITATWTTSNSEDNFSVQGSIIFSEFNLHKIKEDINFNMKDMSNNVSESIIIIKQCITLIQCQVVLRQGSQLEVTGMDLCQSNKRFD